MVSNRRHYSGRARAGQEILYLFFFHVPQSNTHTTSSAQVPQNVYKRWPYTQTDTWYNPFRFGIVRRLTPWRLHSYVQLLRDASFSRSDRPDDERHGLNVKPIPCGVSEYSRERFFMETCWGMFELCIKPGGVATKMEHRQLLCLQPRANVCCMQNMHCMHRMLKHIRIVFKYVIFCYVSGLYCVLQFEFNGLTGFFHIWCVSVYIYWTVN